VWLIGVGGALALLVLAGAAVFIWHSRSAPAQIVGAGLIQGRPPAPDFALTDQFGKPVQFSQFKGKPVALTFLYTNCPDVCPLIASNMHEAYKQLGSQASDVAMVAVTVDPVRDTVDQVRQFSDQRGLTNEWSFLTGSADQLTPVWQRYGILAQPDRPITPAAQRAAQGLPPEPQDIEHSAPVYLVDKTGTMRAALPVDFTPDTLVTDLKVLLANN
jgi:protein SCO1/2